MSNRLEGKIALIMGAGSVGPGWGNGRAIATRFAEEGAKIYGVDRELARMTETIAHVKAANGEIETSFCDVTKTDSILEAVNACIKRFGRIDILVNNVGGSAAGGPVEMSEEVWDSQVDSNLKSVFLTCKHVLPLMEAQGSGGIINIASMLSFQGGIRVPSYTASKSAVMGLTRLLANEWAASGINVNALAPGYMATSMSADLRKDEVRNKAIVERIPAARWGTPYDMAGPAVFLASSAADYVQGYTLAVDGGWLAR